LLHDRQSMERRMSGVETQRTFLRAHSDVAPIRMRRFPGSGLGEGCGRSPETESLQMYPGPPVDTLSACRDVRHGALVVLPVLVHRNREGTALKIFTG